MGYNTTIVIYNDALGTIAQDPDFGKRLVNSILGQVLDDKPLAINAVGENVATMAGLVITQHNADETHLIRVGDNMGKDLGLAPAASPVQE